MTNKSEKPIAFATDIETTPHPVKELIEFIIPGTEQKLVIDVDSNRKNCLVDITVVSLDKTTQDALIHIDNFDNPNKLLTAIYLDGDEPADIFKKDI